MKNRIILLAFMVFCGQLLNAQIEWIPEHLTSINTAPTGVAFDSNDKLIFISQGAGLFEVNNGVQTGLSNSTENIDLTSFQFDGQDIWVGGYGGAGTYSSGSWQNFSQSAGDLQGFAIYDLSANNGSIWAAMENEGASYYNGSSWDHYNASDGIEGNWHTCIAQKNNGEVFLGSNIFDSNGSSSVINKFDGANWTNISVPDLSELTAIYVDNQGDVWIGGDGLLKYDGSTWVNYGSVTFDRNVMSINEANDGKIYFGMSNGSVGYVESGTAVLIDTPDDFTFQGRPDGIAFDSEGEVYFCMGPSNSLSNASYGIYRLGEIVDHSVVLSESQITGCPDATFTIDITIGVDFDSSAMLTVTAPYPVSNSNPLPGETITMTITVPNNTPGNYTDVITVTDGINTTDQNFEVNILGLPTTVDLQVPQNAVTNVTLPVTFDWSTADNANAYNLIVATDNNFNNVIVDTEITNNSFTDALSVLSEQTTYYWMIEAIGDCGMSSSSISSFTTEQSVSTKIVSDQQVAIYPNPVSDFLQLSFDQPTVSVVKLSLLSADGKRVYQKELESGKTEAKIPVYDLVSGIYFLQLLSNDQASIERIVVR